MRVLCLLGLHAWRHLQDYASLGRLWRCRGCAKPKWEGLT